MKSHACTTRTGEADRARIATGASSLLAHRNARRVIAQAGALEIWFASRWYGPTEQKQTSTQVNVTLTLVCIRTIFEQESERVLRPAQSTNIHCTQYYASVQYMACTKHGCFVAGMHGRQVIRPKPRVDKVAKALAHGPLAQRQ
jgi:hypothetical protein